MSTPRYQVTRPISGGYAYYSVIDLRSDVMPNFAVATFYRGMPDAESEAETLAAKLNEEP
jgi:hypothetical protein